MAFSDSLKRFRRDSNLTQKQVADAIGIQKNAYQAYEYGKVKPSIEVLTRMAEAFNVSADYLLGLNDTRNTSESYLLNTYRNLDDNHRQMLINMAAFLDNQQAATM